MTGTGLASLLWPMLGRIAALSHTSHITQPMPDTRSITVVALLRTVVATLMTVIMLLLMLLMMLIVFSDCASLCISEVMQLQWCLVSEEQS